MSLKTTEILRTSSLSQKNLVLIKKKKVYAVYTALFFYLGLIIFLPNPVRQPPSSWMELHDFFPTARAAFYGESTTYCTKWARKIGWSMKMFLNLVRPECLKRIEYTWPRSNKIRGMKVAFKSLDVKSMYTHSVLKRETERTMTYKSSITRHWWRWLRRYVRFTLYIVQMWLGVK